MPTETIEVVDALDAPTYAYRHRPAGNPSVTIAPMGASDILVTHRPAVAFAADPPPPAGVVEHFIMNAQRLDGSHVTWVTPNAPDPSGALAPSGSPLVAASITLVKRGLFY